MRLKQYSEMLDKESLNKSSLSRSRSKSNKKLKSSKRRVKHQTNKNKVKSNEYSLNGTNKPEKIKSMMSKYKRDTKSNTKKGLNTSRNWVMSKIRKYKSTKKSSPKKISRDFNSINNNLAWSVVELEHAIRPQLAAKNNKFKNRRNSCRDDRVMIKTDSIKFKSRPIKSKNLKIKRKSKSRSPDSTKMRKHSNDSSKNGGNMMFKNSFCFGSKVKSPLWIDFVNKKAKKKFISKSFNKTGVNATSKTFRSKSKGDKNGSTKNIYLNNNTSQDIKQFFLSMKSKTPSASCKKTKTVIYKSSPKEARRQNNKSMLSYSSRNTFFKKKANTKVSRCSKHSKGSKNSTQKNFMEFVINTSTNPLSFTKELEQTHARSLFAYQPTRSQVTTNAATLKGTISPESTKLIFGSPESTKNSKVIKEIVSVFEKFKKKCNQLKLEK